MGKLFLALFVLVGCAGKEQVVQQAPPPAPPPPKMVVNKIDGSKIKTMKDIAAIFDALNLAVAYPEGVESDAKKSAEKLKHLFK